jgi:ABC-type molybdate transport system substrate-binding protein
MRAKIVISASVFITTALLGTCNAFTAELRVLLPPPAKGFIEEATRLYAKDHPDVRISFDEAASLALLDKARSGLPFDIVVTTVALMNPMQDERLASDPEQIAEGYSVIAFRKGSPAPRAESPDDIKALVSRANKISLSDPALGGASSNFFMSIAKDQGVDVEVRQKAVFTPGGHGADPVERGEAEYGVAQRSELLTMKNVASVPLIPQNTKSRVPFLAALSSKSSSPDEARNFIQFLKSDVVSGLKDKFGLR